MSEKLKKAYRRSKNIYDDVLTQNNLFSRLYTDLFWQGTDDKKIAETLLAWIPGDFQGKLLDVPCGTAVFTKDKWLSMKEAEITCLDYSTDMLMQAENRLGSNPHIQFAKGDVSCLPYADSSYDIVLSMNGFHAFKDKEKAYREITRVLKPDGLLIACFYIKGQYPLTDFLVKTILAAGGWFTP